ncbi:MAG: M23 family metallopeptidase, partial [Oscillospiraceae bacterium]
LYWLMTALTGLVKGTVRLLGSINYIAPIMAAVVFATVVNVTLHMNFALQVKYNGETVGYISDESVFDRAEKEVLKRIVFEDYIRPEDTVPEFSVSVVKKDQIIDEYELTNQLIQASGNELAEATGLYIDGEFKGAVKSREAIAAVLDEMKAPFRTEGDEGETVEFVKEVSLVDGLYPLTSIADLRNLEADLNKQESQRRIYTAVKGDAPIIIAAKNDIPYSQLKALNPDIEKKLMIGQEVLVEKAVPTLEVKVIRTETYNEDISFKIEQIQDSNKMQGYTQVTQKGQKGIEQVVAKVTYVDGVETVRQEINRSTVKEAVNEKIVVGGKRPLDKIPAAARAASGNFIWPTDGGYLTCAFGSAGYWGHTGMDIGGQGSGAAIRAAAAGTVIKVVYNNYGYGYHVMVDHGGGVQTLYAHNSKIYVKVGDWVEQGELIAGMGRTGNATGIHVHFEIRVNGKYMNPANYIGTRCPY